MGWQEMLFPGMGEAATGCIGPICHEFLAFLGAVFCGGQGVLQPIIKFLHIAPAVYASQHPGILILEDLILFQVCLKVSQEFFPSVECYLAFSRSLTARVSTHAASECAHVVERQPRSYHQDTLFPQGSDRFSQLYVSLQRPNGSVSESSVTEAAESPPDNVHVDLHKEQSHGYHKAETYNNCLDIS